MVTYLAFLGPIGWQEILLILLVGVLLFGARLPEVGRSLGRGLLEFKKGLRGIQDQMTDLEREADRKVDDELERRRLAASQEVPSREAERRDAPEFGVPGEAPPGTEPRKDSEPPR